MTRVPQGTMLTLLPNEHWNYSAADAMHGLRVAVSHRPPLSAQHIHIPGVGACLPVRSARAAIVLALKALDLPPGASVGVPLYCCPVVFKAIRAAGCRIRFIDVDPETYCLSVSDLAAKRTEIDALVAVHMFGNMCDIPGIRDAAPGIPVIEDCAQALGSALGGRAAGSLGDVAVFSFRSGKYLSVGEGGALYTADDELASRVARMIGAFPAPGRVEEAVHVMETFLRAALRSRPLWGLIGDRLWAAYSANVSYTSQSPLVLSRIYETDRDLTLRRLALLDGWIEKQRSNADYYARKLAVDARMLCRETPGAFFNRLQFPLRAPTTDQRDWLAASLRTDEISTATPYSNIAAIAATHYDYAGDCPCAERIAATVLVIPCHHALESADRERVVARVNRAWRQAAVFERRCA